MPPREDRLCSSRADAAELKNGFGWVSTKIWKRKLPGKLTKVPLYTEPTQHSSVLLCISCKLATMADEDFDLDAMLDSALDEEFEAPATAAEAGGESDGELDLDAMLDEAMVSTALDGESAPQPAPKQKQGVTVASEKTSATRQGLVAYGIAMYDVGCKGFFLESQSCSACRAWCF